ARTLNGCFVRDGAGSRTVAVDAVGAGAQNDEAWTFATLIGQAHRAAQDGFEIATAATIAAHGTRKLATRDCALRCWGQQVREQHLAACRDWLFTNVAQNCA